MSSSGGGYRVSIPDGARKTIQDIREITGKQHSDEEIYSVLRDCSMDPNETAQKLLYLDTFHEVKRKHDRRKEVPNNRGHEDYMPMPGTRGRGAWGGQDGGGWRNAAPRRENGFHHERGPLPSLLAAQRTKNKAVPHVSRASPAVPDGPSNYTNGSSSHGHGSQLSVDGDKNENKSSAPVDVENHVSSGQTFSSVLLLAKPEKSTLSANHLPTLPTVSLVSGDFCSASSDPALPQPPSRHAGDAITIKWEAGSQQKANKLAFHNSEAELPKSEIAISMDSDSTQKKKGFSKSKAVQKNQPSEPVEVSSPSTLDCSLQNGSSSNCNGSLSQKHNAPSKVFEPQVAVKANSQLLSKSDVSDGQHVTFPNHFQVPQALKNGITFGSFDEIAKTCTNEISGTSDNAHATESSQGIDGNAGGPYPSSEIAFLNAQGDNPDHPHSPPVMLEELPPSNGNMSSSADFKRDQSREDTLLLPGGQEKPTGQNVQNSSLAIMSASAENHPTHLEGPETQRDNSPALSSSSQAPGVQNSVAAPPQPFPIFRQPYPPNYFPYGHFLSPYFMPPVHQFLTPNGLPQQPSPGNIYLPPAAIASGVKFPFPQFKHGSNIGNPTNMGIASGYGSYTSVGFNPVAAVTSGSSASNDDSAQMKENHTYSTLPLQSEGSAVWIPAPGQDLSNLQLNSLYNLPLQGHHFTLSPAQAGQFAGIYQPAQTMAAPANVNPLVRESKTIEASGPPSGAYQQPQYSHISWNSNFQTG